MNIFRKLHNTIENYDPYGLLRVTSLQSFIMVFCIFVINFMFSIPGFNVGMQLPLYGLMAIGAGIGYNQRIRNMVIYILFTLAYVILLSIVQNYRILTVMSVGVVVFSLFTISKKHQPIILMIAPIQAVSYTALIIPFGGNIHQLFEHVFGLAMIGFLGVGLLYLTPRIYFFRIWLRSAYLTVKEFEQKLILFSEGNLKSEQLVFKHLIKFHDFTDGLSYKEYGFAGRRIALKIISIYTLTLALINNVAYIEPHYILEITDLLNKLRRAMSKTQQLHKISLSPTDNKHLILLRHDLLYIIQVWNKLCLKI